MRLTTNSSISFFAIALLIGALPGTAEAYIDPGAGNILMQAVLGGAAGIAVLVRIFARRLKDRLQGRSRDAAEGAEDTRPK
jgi:membrane associated rhomboid family serine protease